MFIIAFMQNYLNMCSRFVRLCCCPCRLYLCLWSVRRTAQRWTRMNSSLPYQTTPCSWLWSLDRHGDHSLYVSPNTPLIYDILLNFIRYISLIFPPGFPRVEISKPQQASQWERHSSCNLWPLQNEPKRYVWVPECEGYISGSLLCECRLPVSGTQESSQVKNWV